MYLENSALDVGFKRAYSYCDNKKTPYDIIKMRSGNCTLISEGGHSKWMMYIVYHIQNGTANIIEAEVCVDHVHMLLEIPPKMSISSFMGYLKGWKMG